MHSTIFALAAISTGTNYHCNTTQMAASIQELWKTVFPRMYERLQLGSKLLASRLVRDGCYSRARVFVGAVFS